MRRKPIQIVIMPPLVLGDGVTYGYLFALCSDGSIWRLPDPSRDVVGPTQVEHEWELVEPDIPQPH